MTITLLILWFLVAIIAEHVLALTPATIIKPWKKALYYAIITPEIALSALKGFIGKWSFHWLAVSSWFRS